MKVEQIDYHRNGVCGEGFYVGIIKDKDGKKVAIRLSKEDDKKVGAICCFVLDIKLLSEGIIRFTENSWRGDHFNQIMDEAIAKMEV